MGVQARVLNLLLKKSVQPRYEVLLLFNICNEFRTIEADAPNFFPQVNLLRDAPTSLTFNKCTFCPHCIYVFCIYLRTNSDLRHLQHKLIGFYNPDEKCLQRCTNWVFK